jgi:hypothetical protein
MLKVIGDFPHVMINGIKPAELLHNRGVNALPVIIACK